MSLLPQWSRFGSGRTRSEADALKEQVTALQAALGQCRAMVRHWTGVQIGTTAVIAALTLALGFVLGVYKEPLTQSIAHLGRGLGFTSRIQPVDAAYAAYERGRYATALRQLRPLAEQGNARARSLLGLLYANGRGVPRDDAAAVKWFRLAAEQGNALGQFHLGSMYSKGQGVPQDYTQAAAWYDLAAHQGNAEAQYELGLLNANGQGMSQDYVSAHKWFNLAAAQFPTSDTRNRRAALYREVVENKMTREQIIEAQKLAREWKAK